MLMAVYSYHFVLNILYKGDTFLRCSQDSFSTTPLSFYFQAFALIGKNDLAVYKEHFHLKSGLLKNEILLQ